jgi:hypothetical protein
MMVNDCNQAILNCQAQMTPTIVFVYRHDEGDHIRIDSFCLSHGDRRNPATNIIMVKSQIKNSYLQPFQ